MQSANISSAKLSSPNSKVLSFNYESRLINRTSIVLSPSDIVPELAGEDNLFSSIETPNGTNTSLPKFLKDGKVLGSSIFSAQTQERIKEGKPFGSSLFSTQERMEKIKDEKFGRRGVSTQENIKRPPPFV